MLSGCGVNQRQAVSTKTTTKKRGLKSTSQVMWTRGWAKAGRRPDWQRSFSFHCHHGGGRHTPRPCPLLWGELVLSNILPEEGGVEWRMRRRAICACFLCLKPLSLTKPSCTCLTGTADSPATSSVATFDTSSFLELRYCFFFYFSHFICGSKTPVLRFGA